MDLTASPILQRERGGETDRQTDRNRDRETARERERIDQTGAPRLQNHLHGRLPETTMRRAASLILLLTHWVNRLAPQSQ